MRQKEIIDRVRSGEYCIVDRVSQVDFISIQREFDGMFIEVINRRQLDSLINKNLIKVNKIDDRDWSSGIYTFNVKETYYVWNDEK